MLRVHALVKHYGRTGRVIRHLYSDSWLVRFGADWDDVQVCRSDELEVVQ